MSLCAIQTTFWHKRAHCSLLIEFEGKFSILEQIDGSEASHSYAHLFGRFARYFNQCSKKVCQDAPSLFLGRVGHHGYRGKMELTFLVFGVRL